MNDLIPPHTSVTFNSLLLSNIPRKPVSNLAVAASEASVIAEADTGKILSDSDGSDRPNNNRCVIFVTSGFVQDGL